MTHQRAALGIVAALPIEAQSLGITRARPGSRHQLGADTILQISGMGQANARRAARQLVMAGVDALASWGFCGALAPRLQAGTVVLPARLVDAGGHTVFHVDGHWHRRLQQELAARRDLHAASGTLISRGCSVSTADAKRQLHQICSAIAVDTESGAIASVAQQAGLPFVAIRSVSDTAGTALPSTALAMLDNSGQLQPLRGLAHWLGHPRQTGAMLALVRDARRARYSLHRVAQRAGPRLFCTATRPLGIQDRVYANAR